VSTAAIIEEIILLNKRHFRIGRMSFLNE
jgi:hypothetical protein